MERSEKVKSLRQILGTLYMSVFRYDKSVVVEKILTDTSVKTETKIEVDFKIVQPDDFPKIANKFKKLEIDAEKMFRSGDMCIVAEANGEIVHWTWVTFKENYVMEMEKKIRIPNSNSAYVYAVYTVPEYRRLGIAPKAMETLLSYLHDRGIRKVFALIHPSNFPSLRYFRKVGFKKIGMIKLIKILKLNLYVCRGETRKDYNTIVEMLSTEEDQSKFQLIY
jgi:ribosomal protein S18 acetylase RimI-like enzyme